MAVKTTAAPAAPVEAGEAYNAKLRVINVDRAKRIVLLRSTDEDMIAAVDQLQSEDAKTLALRAAVDAGAVSPTMKHATIMYGDDEKGVAARTFKAGVAVRPFMALEYHITADADTQYVGDSL